MAKKVSNSVNVQMFYALKCSEVSGVPTLIVSNPGVGKSSTVEMFADIRGYHLITLRGNSTTPEEIMGYDTVPEGVREGSHRAACSLRPSWFQELMDVHEKGGKTLLFLDEITTSTEYVQAALLHLVFERSCKDEKLPKDTLIVAAGNYAQNLTTSMQLLSPMMNRFMIFNIVPKSQDIDAFLNVFDGAAVNEGSKPNDKMKNLRAILDNMDKQEVSISENQYYRVGEYFEKAIALTARELIDHTKEIDWSITDLGTIYSDTDATGGNLYGFVTLRTLGYLVKWAFATYQCFGCEGIKSDNFMKSINGLCGIGVSKDPSSHRFTGDIKLNHIGTKFQQAIISSLQDIEKMNNTALPEYEEFFVSAIKGKKQFTDEEVVALKSKIGTMLIDNRLKNIERPIDNGLVSQFIKAITETSLSLIKPLQAVNTTSPENIDKVITPEQLGGLITRWNTVAELINKFSDVVKDPKFAYMSKEKTELVSAIRDLSKNASMKLQSVKKLFQVYYPGTVSLDIQCLNVFSV